MVNKEIVYKLLDVLEIPWSECLPISVEGLEPEELEEIEFVIEFALQEEAV